MPASVRDAVASAVLRIEVTGLDGSWQGTGFVVSQWVQGPRYIATNRHVLEGGLSFRVLLPEADGGRADPSRIHELRFSGTDWQSHPDPRVDVAVVSLEPLLERHATHGGPALSLGVVELGRGGALPAGEDVLFFGHPNGMRDTSRWAPIVRRGMTATHTASLHRGKPAFLIDASIVPGSSGSPVIAADTGDLLGIVAAVTIGKTSASVTIDGRRAQAEIDESLDLGIVYQAGTIYETIDHERMMRTVRVGVPVYRDQDDRLWLVVIDSEGVMRTVLGSATQLELETLRGWSWAEVQAAMTRAGPPPDRTGFPDRQPAAWLRPHLPPPMSIPDLLARLSLTEPPLPDGTPVHVVRSRVLHNYTPVA